jgi:hypothetical protein
MDRAEAEAIYGSGREACVQFILELAGRVRRREDRLRRLEEQARQDSRTSSKPPSTDPPKTRAQRRADARAKARESSIQASARPPPACSFGGQASLDLACPANRRCSSEAGARSAARLTSGGRGKRARRVRVPAGSETAAGTVETPEDVGPVSGDRVGRFAELS